MLASSAAFADVQYVRIMDNGDRDESKIVRMGIGTWDGVPQIQFFTDTTVVPSCFADVKSFADAVELEKTIREYSAPSKKTLKVWCQYFRDGGAAHKNFITLVFPAL
jgi:hypothetical protein